MAFDFAASELSALAPEQTNALLSALLLASVAGPAVGPDEVQRFREAAAKLPHAPSPDAVAQALSSGQARYEATDPGGYGPWLTEIAAQITDASLRVKTLAIMGVLSLDYLRVEGPRVLTAAVVAFGVAPERVEVIRKAIGDGE